MSKDYFRDRPFLVAHLSYVPRDGVKTHQKGWMEDTGNVKIMERVALVDRLNKSQQLADVVLDLINTKVIRNMTRLNDDDVFADFADRYQNQIEQALKVWAYNEAKKLSDDELLQSLSEGDVLENLQAIGQQFMFESNGAETREKAVGVYTAFLNGVKEVGRVTDYTIQCDDANNTVENELRVDIGVKYTGSEEYTHIPVIIGSKVVAE